MSIFTLVRLPVYLQTVDLMLYQLNGIGITWRVLKCQLIRSLASYETFYRYRHYWYL